MSTSSLSLPLYAGDAHQHSRRVSGNTLQSVTLSRKRHAKRRSELSGGSGVWDRLTRDTPLASLRPSHLTQRARTTNLAVLLLLLTLALSLVYNARFYLHEHPLKGENNRLPFSIRATLPQNALLQQNQAQARRIGDADGGYQDATLMPANSLSAQGSEPVDLASLEHMILVPGHAVWKGRTAEEAPLDEYWVLQDIQKGRGVKTYLKHIMKGVELTMNDPKSLLVFSGGQTRPSAQETEGDSYQRLAEALDLYRQFTTPKTPRNLAEGGRTASVDAESSIEEAADQVDKQSQEGISSTASSPDIKHLMTRRVDDPLFPRATSEQFALDSYQNLLFSLCRFKEVTGRYPARVTVIGYGMKRSRFSDIHRRSIKWPENTFTYIGIDDEGETGQSYVGERENGLQPYQHDMYGCKGMLVAKRRGRNPFRRIHPYFTSNSELAGLLEYCPADGVTIYPKHLPWED